MALEPGEAIEMTAHWLSNWPRIVLAARDSLGVLPFLDLPRERGIPEATRASRTWAFVHDLRYVIPRVSHSCWSSALLMSSKDVADDSSRSSLDSSSSSSSSSKAP